MKEMLKTPITWLLIVFILGVIYTGALEHKKIATDNQPQYTLQNGLTK